MKITKVEATCHVVPVKLILDKVTREPFVFVRVETDEGISGYGITMGNMRFSTRDFINRELAPFLKGKDPLDTERIWNVDAIRELGIQVATMTNSSTVRWGFSAVDIALWDIKGKYLKLPVYRLLGGAQNPVPAYVTFGFRMYNQEELVEVVRLLVQMGQDKLKMNVALGERPGERLAEDVARVKAVREEMGDTGVLMVDANDMYNLIEAKELARRIEQYNIAWFESPLFTNADFRLMAELRRSTSIPIAPGGNLPGRRWMYREAIVQGAVDLIQPNVIHVGGFTEAQKIAHLAQAFSMPVANGGGQPHHNGHVIAGIANGWMVEFHYGHMLRDEVIFVNPPRFERNWLNFSDTPGLGLEPNEAGLKEYMEP